MDITKDPSSHMRKITNVILIVATSVLAIIAFFAIMDLVVAIAAFIVAQNPSEDWVTVQDTYMVITARNVWVFVGGILLLGMFIVAINYHPQRLDNPKTLKVLLWTFAIEVFFIGLSMLI